MAGGWQIPWGLSDRDSSSEAQGSKTLTSDIIKTYSLTLLSSEYSSKAVDYGPLTQKFGLSLATLICKCLSLSGLPNGLVI